MMEEITIKDIARICGVGVSTVSRALNSHPDINEATRQKVMETIKKYNYIPNNSARNLKRIESKSIAVLIKGISNPFFQKMLKVFEAEIQRKKYNFLLQRVDSREDEVETALELVKEKRLKGIIFLGGSFSHSEDKLKQLQVPFILSTIEMAEYTDKRLYSSVAVDNVWESRKMVNYLCSLGHEKIAVLASDKEDKSIGRLRVEGYVKALQDNELPENEELIRYSSAEEDAYTMENGYALTKELLASGEIFTAIYAISDSMAIGAAKALLEAGRRIPEDVSVAGFDGLDIAYYYHPSITTIIQPVEEMAQETIRILFERIEEDAPHKHKVFEAMLTERDSTNRL